MGPVAIEAPTRLPRPGVAFAPAGFQWVTSPAFRKTVATPTEHAVPFSRAAADQVGHASTSMTTDVSFRREVTPSGAAAVLSALSSSADAPGDTSPRWALPHGGKPLPTARDGDQPLQTGRGALPLPVSGGCEFEGVGQQLQHSTASIGSDTGDPPGG